MKNTSSLLHQFLPALLPILLLSIWQIGTMQGFISATILPPPLDVFITAWEMILSGELWTHIWVSSARALSGFLLGGTIGLLLGLFTSSSKFAAALLDSSLQMIRNIPVLALIPLAIIWFGIDEGSKLFLVSLSVFFPIYLNTMHGIKSVDKDLIEMAKTYGLSGWQLYRQVILAGALPSILVGVRFSLGLMWIVLIVAETISATSGIGYMTMSGREFMRLDVVLLGVFIYAILGKLADSFAQLIEKRCLRWHLSYQ